MQEGSVEELDSLELNIQFIGRKGEVFMMKIKGKFPRNC
jgi:hypothetical protein